MHVLIMPSWYKVPDRPVVGTFFEEQARMLTRLQMRVGIFYPLFFPFSTRWHTEDTIPQPEDYIDDGIPTYHHFVHGIAPRLRALNDWHLCRTALSRVGAYCDRFGQPDLIHSHALDHAGLVAAYVARKHDIPFVHTEHLTSLIHGDVPMDRYRVQSVRSVLGGAARCLVVGTGFREDLLLRYELDERQVEVVPNVVSPIFFSDVRPKPRSDPFVFFTNSFLNPRKNHRLLLQAFRIVLERHPDCRLRIGGKAYVEMQDQLEELARELGVHDRVRFLGELGRKRVVRELVECHAFVLASKYESFGVVLIEALACGRPVVTTDSGGPRDIVEPEDGFLVEQHTPEALAEAMLRVIDEYDRFDAEKLSNRCSERFGEEVIGRRILDVYRAAV